MSLATRGRGVAVLGYAISGGVGLISATQTWLTASRVDGGDPLLVAGADALPLLAPLSLAVLALGAASAVTGPVLRLVLGLLAAAAAVVLGAMTAPLVFDPPPAAVASVFTTTTGLAGDTAMRDIIGAITASAWPGVALGVWALLFATSVFAMVTARRWRAGGRRYRTDATRAASTGPLNPVDSWDDLSRGTDPTS